MLIGPLLVLLITRHWWSFIVLYLLAALTDVLDGGLARRWHVTTPAGARLDGAIDFVFGMASLGMLAIIDGSAFLAALPWVLAGLLAQVIYGITSWLLIGSVHTPHLPLAKLATAISFVIPVAWVLLAGLRVPALALAAVAFVAGRVEALVHVVRSQH